MYRRIEKCYPMYRSLYKRGYTKERASTLLRIVVRQFCYHQLSDYIILYLYSEKRVRECKTSGGFSFDENKEQSIRSHLYYLVIHTEYSLVSKSNSRIVRVVCLKKKEELKKRNTVGFLIYTAQI